MSHKTGNYGNLSANKAVRVNSAISANNSPMNSTKGHETVVSDIEIAGFDDPNLDSPFDIDYFALKKSG